MEICCINILNKYSAWHAHISNASETYSGSFWSTAKPQNFEPGGINSLSPTPQPRVQVTIVRGEFYHSLVFPPNNNPFQLLQCRPSEDYMWKRASKKKKKSLRKETQKVTINFVQVTSEQK